MKILIIEDDKAMADIERDFLEMNGFEVAHESDGVKGMERALSGGFNLILLDLMLPGKDCWEMPSNPRSDRRADFDGHRPC